MAAEQALRDSQSVDSLSGLSFVDIGCGSGLSSLAARRLGARVHSFDFDPKSVACTKQLRERFFPSDVEWVVEEGDVLDCEYLARLGTFDIVYSWGVLHHTGKMWSAFENVSGLVRDGGRLEIAIYNDTQLARAWLITKRVYNQRSPAMRRLMVVRVVARDEWQRAWLRLRNFQNPFCFDRWREHRKERGMSLWYDWIDWVGGYPYEVAKPEEIIHFFRDRGYSLLRLVTREGTGCNEFVLGRDGGPTMTLQPTYNPARSEHTA